MSFSPKIFQAFELCITVYLVRNSSLIESLGDKRFISIPFTYFLHTHFNYPSASVAIHMIYTFQLSSIEPQPPSSQAKPSIPHIYVSLEDEQKFVMVICFLY